MDAIQLALQALSLPWGSEEQINAENEFFNRVEATLSPLAFEALEAYSLKATTEERVKRGLLLLIMEET